VRFDFSVENQTETDYTLNLVSILPPAASFNPMPAQFIDDDEEDNFTLALQVNQVVCTFRYRLDDENGNEVGYYNFIFNLNNVLTRQVACSHGLEAFVQIQNNGNNDYDISITCQIEADSDSD
jgi:hypothetical protein